MKKIGIVTDNYKLKRMEKELNAEGIKDFKVNPFTSDTTAIQIEVQDEQFELTKKKVAKVTTKIELHFNRSN